MSQQGIIQQVDAGQIVKVGVIGMCCLLPIPFVKFMLLRLAMVGSAKNAGSSQISANTTSSGLQSGERSPNGSRVKIPPLRIEAIKDSHSGPNESCVTETVL